MNTTTTNTTKLAIHQPLTWQPFTQEDRDYVQELVSALPAPGWSHHIVSISTSGDCSLHGDAVELRDRDMLNIAEYTVTKHIVTELHESIVLTTHREEFRYTVHEPCLIPGSYWEPDEWDIVELSTETSLADAVKAIYLRECEAAFNNVAEGVALARAFKESEESEEFSDVPF